MASSWVNAPRDQRYRVNAPRGLEGDLRRQRLGGALPAGDAERGKQLAGPRELDPRLADGAGDAEQPTESQMAPRGERAHLQLLGDGQGLAVCHARLRDVRGLVPRRDLRGQVQGPSLVAPLA